MYKRKTVDKWKYHATLIILGIALFILIVSFIKATKERAFLNPVGTAIAIEKEVKLEKIKLKVSHYWPPLGGMNCGNFVDGECVSRMANGERWQEHVGEAIACPKELEFGTKIKIEGREWVCKDRGSRITKNGDVYWVDMLIPYALNTYGSEITGEIL